MRLILDDEPTRYTALVRLDIFATVERTTKCKTQRCGVAWQAFNPDDSVAAELGRPGFGSFYWRGAVQAFAAAQRIMLSDPRVQQIKLETISGRPIGRLYR